MKTLRILVAAFLGGVLLAACGRTVAGPEVACFARSADTLWLRNASGDSVPVLVLSGGCP